MDRFFFRFVTMHAFDRRTDRRTDGQTNWQTEFSSLYTYHNIKTMFYYCAFGYINCCTLHMRYCNNNNMYKKSFCDWAYSAPSYLAGLKGGCEGQGRGGRQDTKGGGVVRDRIHHPPLPTIPGSATGTMFQNSRVSLVYVVPCTRQRTGACSCYC